MAPYKGDKFIFSVTIVSKKKNVKTSVFDKENLHWKLLTDDEVLMLMLWYRDMPES